MKIMKIIATGPATRLCSTALGWDLRADPLNMGFLKQHKRLSQVRLCLNCSTDAFCGVTLGPDPVIFQSGMKLSTREST